jgi:hypothetical protein
MAWEEFPDSLGQKRTSISKGSMSDLPPKADIHRQTAMSALCQEEIHARQIGGFV